MNCIQPTKQSNITITKLLHILLPYQLSLSTPPESMEEDAEEEEQTPRSPFWIQSTNLGRLQRYRRRLSSVFFTSFVLIIFLLLIALISMAFIIPSLIQLSSNLFRPNLVKRSWDSINLILVLIALLFGFLTRNIEKPNFDNGYDRTETEEPAGAPIVYGFQDQLMNSPIGLRRRKTSISYPDLRELSPPWNHRGAADPWRFSDDTHLNYYHLLESNRSDRSSFRQQYNYGIQDVENLNSYTPVTPGEGLYFPPPQPPPANPVKQKTKRAYRNTIDDGERSYSAGTNTIFSPETESSEQNGRRYEMKRRARSSEPKRILPPPVSPSTDRKKIGGNSKKKKKQLRVRSADNLGTLLHHSQPLVVKSQPPTPPAPPQPPPPPPRRSVTCATRATITRVAPFVTDKPGGNMMAAGFFNSIDDSSSGGDSPMKHIPPPPPLPPFKMPDWKFAVEGDFVRLQSTLSSRSVSPDGDEAQSPSSDVAAAAVATATASFSLSPDVDTKADSFIARFRAGLKLERMSKLGPGPGLGPNDI